MSASLAMDYQRIAGTLYGNVVGALISALTCLIIKVNRPACDCSISQIQTLVYQTLVYMVEVAKMFKALHAVTVIRDIMERTVVVRCSLVVLYTW